ncbi:NOP14 [Symbiodinium pilosum]|uniref:NOP14 protein n=1 Tax=Symbiodinium pilosum TaxID=2952 RepID=A0A812SS51_SYMPI|nr:NOP14 [Symbiodinium pilosum]
MPRTVGLPTYAAVPDKAKKLFPEKSRKPMIRLYCFPGAADNYMLWLELATSAPEWCEVAVYEPRAHGFRPDEAWDRSLEERAEDAFNVMRPAFETHAKGGVSEGAPFGFLSHGVGGQFMALLAYRLKQELNLEPLVVFANDGPPPNIPTLSDEGYRMLCEDVLGFYRLFQPDTMDQYEKMGGAGNRAAEALIQKWSRGLRLFEEHARRTVARGEEALYHKFNCDLHVLVAKHTVDTDLLFAELKGPQRDYWERRKKITGSNAESGCNWDRDAFKAWEPWTTEDFHYHEVETDHMTIKNSPLMRQIVFKELGGFCGMDY